MQSVKLPRYIDGVSTGATITGGWINVMGCRNISFQAKWTGTTLGVIGVDVSNDGPADNTGLTPSGNIGATALTLTSAMTAAAPAGSASNFLYEFRDMSVNWIRLVYTRTSGTGTLKVGAKAS